MTSSAAPLAIADRALLAALRGWSESVDTRFWNCFEPGWRQILQNGWNEVIALSPEEAQEQVRREQQAQRHPDWSRIHPSWWLRALKNESPAVQRAVVAHAPRSIREPLKTGLGLSDEDVQGLGASQPEALSAAMALWSERLVGDWPDRDDPLVIVALTQLDLAEITRLIAAVGLAKWTLSGSDVSASNPQSHARRLHLAVQSAFAGLDPRLKTQAELDVARFGQVEQDKLGSIGLITFARLLEVSEPYRMRWALQHLPYSVAKLMRTQMTRAKSSDPAIVGWESELLRFVWDRLRDEGRIADTRGAMP
ncbi:hypothetical protein [Singulisphaera acidiphila]|uniref:Uncharacterized protein n=1 Tax=Singulisphaera acidiphila (strain ATCC BAA-1392 / DSM 18658 / VKM B-2454 / MOB10) TaxID=886293 RepID=L0DJN0_SINAD|nr:hypothetical protein [Singulisphaera acidiphila]AGA29457.1 hypothetical protein Sinac_5307 [Singulisphaera acidiphila DSM 18658]